MDEILTIQTTAGWVPGNQEAVEAHQRGKVGQTKRWKSVNVRNPKFHRKFFALLNTAFDFWEPGEINSKYGVPEKNFDRFREDLTILAGFYKITIRVDGTTRPEAKSISFANMDEEEFGKLYSAMIDVIIKHIMPQYTRDDVNEIIDRVMEFA